MNVPGVESLFGPDDSVNMRSSLLEAVMQAKESP